MKPRKTKGAKDIIAYLEKQLASFKNARKFWEDEYCHAEHEPRRNACHTNVMRMVIMQGELETMILKLTLDNQ